MEMGHAISALYAHAFPLIDQRKRRMGQCESFLMLQYE